MLINIGGLWESPTAIADERPISPADYSAINNYESERNIFRSYDKEFHTTAAGHDVTDFIYFKSVTPEERDQDETNLHCNTADSSGTFHENFIETCYGYMEVNPIPPNKESDNEVEKCEKEAVRDRPLTHSGAEKSDIKVHLDINGGSGQHLRGHTSKALRVRSSTAKDRHSKVNTAKGLRDRRMRLSVSTAIQFYNLQDKLGLDQPSKALDWLMSKAKSAIDELSRPSSISELHFMSSNSVTSLIDTISTSGEAERVSHSVPSSLTCLMEKPESKMGSTAGFIEERKWEDLKVAAKNVCSERKRRHPSVLQKKGNKQEDIALTSPSRRQSGCCDIGFSCPDNIITCLAPFSSSCMPSGQDGTDGQEMDAGTRPPFVVYSSPFESSQHAGETNNLSEKCMSPLVFSLQDSDSIYVEESSMLSGMLNGHKNRGLSQFSSSATDTTDGTSSSGSGFDRVNPKNDIKAFYFAQEQ